MRYSTVFATALAGTAFSKDITVGVGNKNGDLIFNPDEITAEEGDMIHFKFWPKNHSVAQSTFAAPCEPMENGFWSGFVNTTDNEKAADTTFIYEVTNASAPIWFYCTQGQHCQGGMVGVINPPQNNPNRTLDAFKELAADASENVSPQATAGEGGELNTTSSGAPDQPGAASTLQMSSFAFSMAMGLTAYLLL